jgi:hypothetical protein
MLPQRVTVVREEIRTWIEFDEKLEELQLWLVEVQEMCVEWKTQENSAVLIQNLEVWPFKFKSNFKFKFILMKVDFDKHTTVMPWSNENKSCMRVNDS